MITCVFSAAPMHHQFATLANGQVHIKPDGDLSRGLCLFAGDGNPSQERVVFRAGGPGIQYSGELICFEEAQRRRNEGRGQYLMSVAYKYKRLLTHCLLTHLPPLSPQMSSNVYLIAPNLQGLAG